MQSKDLVVLAGNHLVIMLKTAQKKKEAQHMKKAPKLENISLVMPISP